MMPPHLGEDESSFYDRLATDRRSIRSRKTYQSTSPPKVRDRTSTFKRSGKLPVFTEFTDSPQKDDDCSLLDIISEIMSSRLQSSSFCGLSVNSVKTGSFPLLLKVLVRSRTLGGLVL